MTKLVRDVPLAYATPRYFRNYYYYRRRRVTNNRFVYKRTYLFASTRGRR